MSTLLSVSKEQITVDNKWVTMSTFSILIRSMLGSSIVL
jgi:hypothetical protein